MAKVGDGAMVECANCTRLEAVIAEQGRALEELRKKVQELEEKANQNSSNSHKPPSSDFGAKRGYAKRKKSERKRGGQPGHPGKSRELLPEEKVNEMVDVRPKQCQHCREALEGDDPEPRRHQVTELPPIVPVVTEYRFHSLKCAACGKKSTVEPAAGLGASSFGPKHAWVCTLSAGYKLSKRSTKKLLEENFSLPASVGSVVAMEQRSAQTMVTAYEELRQFVRKQEKVNVDETAYPQQSGNGWLWVAATETVALFDHATSRGGSIVRGMLGNDYDGIVSSDRYAVYNYWPEHKRQLCWSHLIRDFRRIASRQGSSGPIGESLLGQAEKLFHQWHRLKSGNITHSTFRSYLSTLRTEIRHYLQLGAACDHPRTVATCLNLLEHETAMYSFGRIEGIEPTNNHAERMIRHAVQWRNSSYGVQSAAGSTFLERSLTAVQTLRLQGRSLWDWLVRTISAPLSGASGPSLLPDTS